MNKKIVLAALAVLIATATPTMLCAQTDVDLDPEFGGRLSVGIDKKLTRGLHLTLDEEIRFHENFSSLNRLQTNLGMRYKVNNYLRLGIGYSMINPYSSTNTQFKNTRHRVTLDVTGGYSFGAWRLSLRERGQATFRTGDFNQYQTPQPLIELKSRLKLNYKGFQRWQPYVSVELRHTLNAPVINAYYSNGSYLTEGYDEEGNAGWFISGWNGTYLNRIRFSLGTTYRLSKASELDFYLLADRISEKSVDANAEGTKLKNYTREKGFVGWAGVSYTYKF